MSDAVDMAALHDRAGYFLALEWEALMDDCSAVKLIRNDAIVLFLQSIELLTPDQAELWMRRFRTCPDIYRGWTHALSGARSWCAYCGDIKPREVGD